MDQMTRTKYSYLTLLSILLALALTGMCSKASAHSRAITECRENIIYKEAVLVYEDVYGSTGLWAEAYDTNGDGAPDVMALSHIINVDAESNYTHKENPIFWVVDLNFDGMDDQVYIDVNGEGDCHDIKLYLDRRDPADTQPNYNSPRGEQVL